MLLPQILMTSPPRPPHSLRYKESDGVIDAAPEVQLILGEKPLSTHSMLLYHQVTNAATSSHHDVSASPPSQPQVYNS